jgi:CRP/FNR family transcriptional regulator, anaerobic regulatory protein
MLTTTTDEARTQDAEPMLPAEARKPPQTIGSMMAAKHLCQAGARKVPAHETIWCEGDERTHIFVVRSGAVCLSRLLPDGRRIVLGFAYPGDVIGIGGDIHQADAHTVQTTRLDGVPAAAFKRAISEDPAFGRCATAEMNRALDAAYRHVVVISKLTACERLASFLMALSLRNGRHGLSPLSAVLPMKRIDIADFLGLTIETVSRTFTQLKASGLIAMDQCNIVVFKDIQKLGMLAAGEGERI